MASKAGAANSKVKAGAVNLTVGTIIKVTVLRPTAPMNIMMPLLQKQKGA